MTVIITLKSGRSVTAAPLTSAAPVNLFRTPEDIKACVAALAYGLPPEDQAVLSALGHLEAAADQPTARHLLKAFTDASLTIYRARRDRRGNLWTLARTDAQAAATGLLALLGWPDSVRPQVLTILQN